MAKEEVKEDVFKDVDFGELIDPQANSILADTGPIKEEDFFQLPVKEDKKEVKEKEVKEDTKKPAAEEVVEDPDEELEKVKDDKKKSDPSHDDSQIATDSSIALVFARFQNERGTLSNFDEEAYSKIIEEQGDEAALEYLYDNEIEFRAEEVKKQYAEDAQEYMSLKDADIDPQTAAKLVSTKFAFNKVTPEQLEEDEDLRKKVLVQDLKNNTKYSDEDIEEMVENWVTTGKDVDKAKKALPNVNKFNEDQIKVEKQAKVDAEKNAQLQRDASMKKMKDTIYSMTEIMGQTITKPTQAKIEKFWSEGGINNWFKTDGEKKTAILAYAISTGLLDGNLKPIKDKIKTSYVKELEEKFKRKGTTLDGQPDLTLDNEKGGINTLKGTFGNLGF